MINKSHLDMFEFDCIEDYFDVIMERHVMGADAKSLFSQLSDKQKEMFFDYVETSYYYDAESQDEITMSISALADALK